MTVIELKEWLDGQPNRGEIQVDDKNGWTATFKIKVHLERDDIYKPHQWRGTKVMR